MSQKEKDLVSACAVERVCRFEKYFEFVVTFLTLNILRWAKFYEISGRCVSLGERQQPT